jgi:hypothetical protein
MDGWFEWFTFNNRIPLLFMAKSLIDIELLHSWRDLTGKSG